MHRRFAGIVVVVAAFASVTSGASAGSISAAVHVSLTVAQTCTIASAKRLTFDGSGLPIVSLGNVISDCSSAKVIPELDVESGSPGRSGYVATINF